MQNIKSFSLGAVLLCLNFSLPAIAASTFDQGMEQFHNKRFSLAANLFEQAIKDHPSDQQSYLWLGQTLEQLKDRDGAKSAYEACYSVNPFSVEGREAKQALMNVINYQAVLQHPVDSPAIVNKTVQTIDRQANDLKQAKVDYGNANAQYRMRLGALEAARIGYEMQLNLRDVQQDMHNFARNNRHYRGPLYYDVTGIQELSNQAQINASYQVTDARVQARRYQQEALNAALETQKSANNLTSLLGETARPGEPKLRALGTNLFVRNYADFDRDDMPPEEPPVELKATARRLADEPQAQRAVAKQLAAPVNN